jgi:hypothetical protein
MPHTAAFAVAARANYQDFGGVISLNGGHKKHNSLEGLTQLEMLKSESKNNADAKTTISRYFVSPYANLTAGVVTEDFPASQTR